MGGRCGLHAVPGTTQARWGACGSAFRRFASAFCGAHCRGPISGQRCALPRRAYPRQMAAPSKPNPARVATATQGLIRRITATN